MTNNQYIVCIHEDLEPREVAPILYEHVENPVFKIISVPNTVHELQGETENSTEEMLKHPFFYTYSSSPLIYITGKPLKGDVLFTENAAVISIMALPQATKDYRATAVIAYRAAIILGMQNLPNITKLRDFRNIKLDVLQQEVVGRMTFSRPPAPVHVIITHGIRTKMPWAETAREILTEQHISTQIFRYKRVASYLIALDPGIRKYFAKKFLRRINSASREHPHKRLSLVVHSYGSMILASALEIAEELDIRISIDALILNASVLPVDYDWNAFTDTGKQRGVSINRILNLCGDSDSVPIIANHFVIKAGDSGTYFFSDDYDKSIVNHRLPSTNHRTILNPKHIKQIWGKYLLSTQFRPNPQDAEVVVRVRLLDGLLLFGKRLLYIYLGFCLVKLIWAFLNFQFH